MPTPSFLFSIPGPLKAQSTVFELKNRLDWGEPALTIIDVRSRDAFNSSHITGAILISMDELVVSASASLGYERDIYVYGDSDEQAAEAASKLREIGFQNVSELTGGLAAWNAANGAIEGVLVAA
ncbi:MAG: rhodanese-like domain-containing protein [Cyanobacteria bacterium P01_D01_bin.156]